MDQSWITLIAAIAGGLLTIASTVALKFVETHLQNKNEERKNRIAKLEALHLAIGLLVPKAHEFSQSLIAQEAFKRSDSERIADFAYFNNEMTKALVSVTSMVRIHAPEARDAWNKALERSADFAKLTGAFADRMVDREKLQASVMEFSFACSDVGDAIERKIEGFSKYRQLKATRREG